MLDYSANLESVLTALEVASIERDLAIETCHALEAQMHARERQITQICALSHTVLPPYAKLALITAPTVLRQAQEQRAPREDGLTRVYMSSWEEAVGCGKNTLYKNIEPVCGAPGEEGATIYRDSVQISPTETAVYVGLNQRLLDHPRLIAPAERRKVGQNSHNCGNCGNPLHKMVSVTYLCSVCGIDYDSKMQSIDHT